MKRIITLIVWIIAIFSVSPTRAMARNYDLLACKKIMAQNPPKITVQYTFNKLQYDFSLSEKQLEAIFHEVNPNQPMLGKILGMNRLIPEYTITTSTSPHVLRSDNICHIPSEIIIKISYNKPTIYVANSLPKDSCRFKVTLRHEQAHADVGYSAMMLLVRSLRNQMPKIAEEQGPRVSSIENSGNIAQSMSEDYVNRTKYIFQIFQDTLIEQQARYDSEENYLEESQLCRKSLL